MPRIKLFAVLSVVVGALVAVVVFLAKHRGHRPHLYATLACVAVYRMVS